jgi:hypothetical protein
MLHERAWQRLGHAPVHPHMRPERSCLMQIKQHLLDKRVIKRALQEGLVDKATYQKTLDDLPDLSGRIQAADEPEEAAAPVSLDAPPSSAPSPTTNSF